MKPPRTFWKSERGIAAVEFALIAPIMLLTYLGATDLTQALAIDRKLNQVAATVSDLVAQQDGISRNDVQAIFDVGTAIMRPFDFDQTRLRLTIVKVDGASSEVTAATHRNWAIEAPIGQSYALSDELMSLTEGRYAVIASASYAYRPMFGTIFNASVPLEQRSIHVARHEMDDFGFALANSDEPDEDEGGGGGTGSNPPEPKPEPEPAPAPDPTPTPPPPPDRPSYCQGWGAVWIPACWRWL